MKILRSSEAKHLVWCIESQNGVWCVCVRKREREREWQWHCYSFVSLFGALFYALHLLCLIASLTLSSFAGAMSPPFPNTPKRNHNHRFPLHSTCAHMPPIHATTKPLFLPLLSLFCKNYNAHTNKFKRIKSNILYDIKLKLN